MRKMIACISLALITTLSPVHSFHASDLQALHFSRHKLRVLPPRADSGIDDAPQLTTHFESSQPETWKPSVASLSERKQHFRDRNKHNSETLGSLGFHHIEFYTGDALMTAKRFELALGIPVTCWSSLATGNDVCVSYGLECGVVDGETGEVRREPGEGVRFLITAPLSRAMQKPPTEGNKASTNVNSNVKMTAPIPLPGYDVRQAHDFFCTHGLAVRAVGIEVQDAKAAYEAAIHNGGVSNLPPTSISSFEGGKSRRSGCMMAEIQLYGDVMLRLISFDDATVDKSIEHRAYQKNSSIPFLPHLAPYPSSPSTSTYGLTRIDHAVGNVPNLLSAQKYLQTFSGFHPFAEFTPEDVGTVESGLNSVVLASDSEDVLLPLNEPTEGKRKSQIQTFLEQNEGPGLQHIAIKTKDIFETIARMRHAEKFLGGFELMVRPSNQYYRELPGRLGDRLTEDQYSKLEELGILADADDEGVLLQIFTKSLGDRPTLFIEIIQRIGCVLEQGETTEPKEVQESSKVSLKRKIRERPGCGGFGQGNFRELFKAIEDHEKTLKV